MIKMERKRTEKSKKAIASLEIEKSKNGSYNTPEVNAAVSWKMLYL